MFINLKVEMIKARIRQKDLANLLGISVQAINYKMTGKTEFRNSEMTKIQAKYFKDYSLDYLFKK